MDTRQVQEKPDQQVTEEVMWCELRGVFVPSEECVTSCAAPEHRPICFLWRRPVERQVPDE
jgi:hypothetical protein